MAERANITPDLLRQLLRYEPETGKLFWKLRDVPEGNLHIHSWNARLAGKEALTAKDSRGYFHGTILYSSLRAHRVIWAMHHGEWPKGEIDHINHDKTDNRADNLRVVSHKQNLRNRSLHKNSSSGFTGVVWHKSRGKWRAQIGVNGVTKYLGLFETIDDAIAARKAADSKHGFHENHGGSQCL